MNNIRHAISNTFNTKTTKVMFKEYEKYPMMNIDVDVTFKKHKSSTNVGKNFLNFKISQDQPLFHSIRISELGNIDKFNQMFQMHKYSRNDFSFINDILNTFQHNVNFSKFLKLNKDIKTHEFYTFENLFIFEKDNNKYGITSCVNGAYRNVVQYEFIKSFAITRDEKVSLFPIISFFSHINPFSLYFNLHDKKVYKLPSSLIGLVTVEDIIEASTLFTNHDIDVFTDEILMTYVNNLHHNFYHEFLEIPKESLADKIELLMMTAI